MATFCFSRLFFLCLGPVGECSSRAQFLLMDLGCLFVDVFHRHKSANIDKHWKSALKKKTSAVLAAKHSIELGASWSEMRVEVSASRSVQSALRGSQPTLQLFLSMVNGTRIPTCSCTMISSVILRNRNVLNLLHCSLGKFVP